MKKLFLLLYLSLNIFTLQAIILEKKHLTDESKILLESISKYAVKIGTGTINTTYIFVDPMCQHSKTFITKISENKMAQLINTYYIFLYRLPKFPSHKLSQYIYQSQNQKETLLKVMVEDEKINLDKVILDDNIQMTMDKVAEIGHQLKVEIRPYVMKFEKGSKYCTVSSGTAPCLEELDFN